MSGDFMFALDIIMLVSGGFLLIAPEKAMNLGRAEKTEISKKGLIMGRIFGAFAMVLSGVYIYFGRVA